MTELQVNTRPAGFVTANKVPTISNMGLIPQAVLGATGAKSSLHKFWPNTLLHNKVHMVSENYAVSQKFLKYVQARACFSHPLHN